MPEVAATASHWPFAVFLIGIALMCAFMLGVSALLGGKAWGRAKNLPFESGAESLGDARLRFSAKFYLVAMLFVIFDVEALYLFAWAVSVREVGWAGFIEATVFVAFLLVGLIYLARIGALDWAPRKREPRRSADSQE